MTDLDRCRAEQRAAAAHLAANPDDRGARIWLADWMAEELLILAEKSTTPAFAGIDRYINAVQY